MSLHSLLRPSPDRGQPWYRNLRRQVASDALSTPLSILVSQYLSPVALRLGASAMQVGWMQAAPYLGHLIGPVWAQLFRGRAPARTTAVLRIGAALSLALFAFAPGGKWGMLLIALLCQGMLAGAYTGATSIIPLLYPPDKRGFLLSRIRLATALTGIASTWLLGQALDLTHHLVPFWSVTLLALAGGALFLTIRVEGPDEPAGRTPLVSQVRSVFADPLYTRYLMGRMFWGLGNLTVIALIPIYQVKVLGLSNAELAYSRIAQAVLAICCLPLWGPLIDRMGPRRAMMITLGTLLVSHSIYVAGGGFTAVIVAGALMGVLESGNELSWNLMMYEAAGKAAAAYTGVHQMMLGIRGIIGPLVGTALIGVLPMQTVFLIGPVCTLVALYLVWAAKPTQHQVEPGA